MTMREKLQDVGFVIVAVVISVILQSAAPWSDESREEDGTEAAVAFQN